MQIKSFLLGAVCAAAFAATPAMAQDAEEGASSPITVSGGVTLTSDYRFRGVSQTSGDPAVQGTINVAHESGLYAGVWASTLNSDPVDTFANDTNLNPVAGYGNVEIDLYGGFAKSFDNGLGIDVGLLYYFYADADEGADTDFFEPYAKLNYAIGPVSTTLGAAYAWGGQDGLDFTTDNDDNIYAFFDASIGIPSTPVTLKGHVGYTDGSLGYQTPSAYLDGNFGPGLDVDDTINSYWDWAITAEAKGGPFTVGVSYVDTDISETQFGGVIDDGFANETFRGSTVLAYIGASF